LSKNENVNFLIIKANDPSTSIMTHGEDEFPSPPGDFPPGGDESPPIREPLSSPHEGTSIFASPDSVSGLMGGDKRGPDFGLVYIGISKSVCGGAIGTKGLKFCLKEDCQMVAHGKTKVDLRRGTLYLHCRNSMQARVNPNLEACLLSDEELEETKRQRNSHEVWKTYFDGIAAFEGKTGNAELDLEDVKIIDEVEKPSLADLKSAHE
jgi:hypothetical protein